MTMRRILLASLFVVTLMLVVYALPVAKLDISGSQYSFPSLDVNAIFSNNSDVGNLRKSSGIFPTKIYTVVLQEEVDKQTFDETFEVLSARLSISQLNDIELTGFFNATNSYFEFEVPFYYHNQDELVSWVSKTGKIDFLTVSQEGSIQPANLTSRDFTTTKFSYDSTYKDHLKLILTDSAKATYYSILLAQNSVIMSIDDREEFILIPQLESQTTQSIDNEVVLVLGTEFSTIKQKQMILNLASSLLNTKPLDVSLEQSTSASSSPEYSVQGASLYVYSLIVLLLITIGYAYQKFNRINFIQFCWSLILTISLTIALLKIVSATVSVGTVFASFFLIAGFLLTFRELVTSQDYQKLRSNLMKVSIYVVIVCLLTLLSDIQINYFYDVLGVFVAGFLSLILVLLYPITIIKNLSE